jgi:hypothetical protein
LLAALLRLAAMLVGNAANFLRMRLSRLSGECHTDATPQTLPKAKTGKLEKPTTAAPLSPSNEGLMVSSSRSERLSRTTRPGSPPSSIPQRAQRPSPGKGDALGALDGEQQRSGSLPAAHAAPDPLLILPIRRHGP